MRKLIILFAICMYSVGVFATIPEPLLEYLFNEQGVYAYSTGSLDVPLRLVTGGGYTPDLTDIHSAAGEGVSGSLGDRCLDNSRVSEGVYGSAKHEQYNEDIHSLVSFTLQGWYKTTTNKRPSHGSRLFDYNRAIVLCGWNGALYLDVGGKNIVSGLDYTETESWVFFAVTFDGTKNEDNVCFYHGTKNKATRLVHTGTLDVQMGPAEAGWHLSIGSWFFATTYPFDGYIDNIRLFGSKKDDSGVLTREQLEAIRIADSILVPDWTKSEVTADRTSVAANGEDVLTITVRAVDAYGTLLAGKEVSLRKVDGDLPVDSIEAFTDENGEAVFELASTRSGFLIFETSIESAQGLPPVILRDQRLRIEFN